MAAARTASLGAFAPIFGIRGTPFLSIRIAAGLPIARNGVDTPPSVAPCRKGHLELQHEGPNRILDAVGIHDGTTAASEE